MRDFLVEHIHDIVAGLVTLILTVGVLALVLLERRVPEFLVGATGTALGYTFRSGVQAVGVKRTAPRRKAGP
jgi:hypothetical protein